jgi:alpha-amylase
VQVAPPQDSLSRTAAVDPAVLHPWWEVYQPVDYGLTSRMGTEAQFRSMVATCRAAGVGVIVDAVVNHMTGQGTQSYGGKTYTKYNYAGIYSTADFHHSPTDCPQSDGTIHDFNNYTEVTRCELVGLSDLRTETTKVRDTTAAYLNKLLSYGVSGFRVDAAKHVGQADLAAIESRLHRTVDGTTPYIALEIGKGSPGRLSPQAFTGQGAVLGFDAAGQLRDAFKSYPTEHVGDISTLSTFGPGSGLLPSAQSLTFVENHDTERNGDTLSYKDGATNVLATEYLLARGYGRPQVYSSFTFTTSDDSPPSDATGHVTNTVCGAAWTCLDSAVAVRHLVALHNTAGNAPVANQDDSTLNVLAFSRGNRAWIALNNSTKAVTKTFATGLKAGTYCDVVHGGASSTNGRGTCSGPTVKVDKTGRATVSVPAKDAVATEVHALVRG